METTNFYKIMKEKLRESELSITSFAKQCGICKPTMVDFFAENKPLRPIRNSTMGRIHKALGIDYEIMEEHNRLVREYRKRGN